MIPRRHISAVIRLDAGGDKFLTLPVSGLHMEFTATKDLSSEPNEGVLKIWNLSNTVANNIRTGGIDVAISAGYDFPGSNGDKGKGVVFTGEIRDVEQGRTHSGKLGAIKSAVTNTQKGVNYLTTIKLGGSYKALTEAYFRNVYAGGVSVRQIISDAISTMQMSSDGIDRIPDRTLTDFVYSGRTKDLLDLLVNSRYGTYWYTDANVVYFQQEGVASSQTRVLVNEETGLLSAPELLDDGIKLVVMMNPAIQLNRVLDVETQLTPQARGRWKVRKLELSGNDRDGDHQMEIEAIANG